MVSLYYQLRAYKCCQQSDTPYKYAIPGWLRPGMAFYVQGVVSGQTFVMNFLTNEESGDDIAFHLRHELNALTCCNSFRHGRWEKQEHTSEYKLSEGSAFDIFIVIKTEGYEVYLNGKRCYLFKHRMSLEKVNALKIDKDVIINTVGVVKNWTTSTFNKELNSGISRTKLSDIQYDIPHPVSSPSKAYSGPIPGGLRAGVALFFQGVVASDCDCFAINLHTGANNQNIAFHFNPRMDSVVLNSYTMGKWDNYLDRPGGPFVRGGAFDIIMVVNPENYEVIVNGLKYCTFNHRIPVDKVTTLAIVGDVFMNNFSIIELVKTLKITYPAYI
ncbi:galectin-4-like [Silurus meridionalis]|uniref:galectin-4-like n=1 Tax=Silurus meridionalis TaxID=175797 RepID=UPI001EEBBD75|nr:galectin-4-like [Silurus meridionalis]